MIKKIAVAGFVLVAACGSLNTGPQTHAITLSYKTGDTYKYHYHAVLNYTIGIQSMSIPVRVDLAADEKITVKSVDSSGTADLTADLSNVTVKTTANGTTNTTTTDTPTSLEMKVASDGRVVSVNGSSTTTGAGVPGIPGGQGGLISAILPDKAVKVGDTWTKAYDQTPGVGTGSVHVTSSNKYARDEKVGSVNAAVVESTINTTINLSVDTASGQGGSSLLPGEASGLSGVSITGTDLSTVSSWVDIGAKRLVKTHQNDAVDATLNFTMAPGSAANPMLTGPLTLKGTQVLDMTPA